MNLSSANTDAVALHALDRPDALAIHDLTSGRKLTYLQLDEQVSRCAAWLAGRGVAVGERVAVLSKNSAEMAVLHLACERAGVIFVPLNWRLSTPELAFVMQDAAPVLLIVQSQMAATGAELAAYAPMVKTSDDLTDAIHGETAALPYGGFPSDTPITLLYTSGTSGRPKGAIITSGNVFYSTVNYALTVEVTTDSVALCEPPLFHVLGLLAILRSTLLAGGTVLMSDGFEVERTLARLTDPDLGVTHYCCVPQMAQMLRNQPAYRTGSLAKLKALVTGGAPHPPAEIERWIDEGVQVSNGYGMTEAGSVFSVPLTNAERLRETAGAAGVRLLTTQVRLANDAGEEVAPGEAGEVWLRGPAITPGYWNRPEETAKAFTADGWFKTGDIARQDRFGYYWLIDRKKDMFISGGENVYPAEVEAAIVEMAGVAETAVRGVPDERWGEVGHAYVVPAPGKSLEAGAIAAHLKARLAGYKVPKRVFVVKALPRNAAGKVQKHLLVPPDEAP